VYSPWLKNWLPTLHEHPEYLEEAPTPSANPESIHGLPVFSTLFSTDVPASVDGFECTDKEKMEELWPAGTEAAMEVCIFTPTRERPLNHTQTLRRFLYTKARKSQIGNSSTLADEAEGSIKESRIAKYANDRNRTDFDSSSRIR